MKIIQCRNRKINVDFLDKEGMTNVISSPECGTKMPLWKLIAEDKIRPDGTLFLNRKHCCIQAEMVRPLPLRSFGSYAKNV